MPATYTKLCPTGVWSMCVFVCAHIHTFSSSTRSILFLPRGLMSFKMSAMIMSMPLHSCVAMQFWKTQWAVCVGRFCRLLLQYKRTSSQKRQDRENSSNLIAPIYQPHKKPGKEWMHEQARKHAPLQAHARTLLYSLVLNYCHTAPLMRGCSAKLNL